MAKTKQHKMINDNTAKSEGNRDTKTGRFLPGNKANPGGRPKDPTSEFIRKKFESEKEIKEFVERIFTIFRNDKDLSAALKACNIILERGFGKAPQNIDVTSNNEPVRALVEFISATKPKN